MRPPSGPPSPAPGRAPAAPRHTTSAYCTILRMSLSRPTGQPAASPEVARALKRRSTDQEVSERLYDNFEVRGWKAVELDGRLVDGLTPTRG